MNINNLIILLHVTVVMICYVDVMLFTFQTSCSSSTVCGFLMSTPRVAAAAIAHVVAKGAPITIAQGHAVSRITKPRWIQS